MATQTIEIGQQTPIAAASALKKVGYNVTSGGKPVNVSEIDDKDGELTKNKKTIHTKKWDRCVQKVKNSGKSEKAAYRICSSTIEDAGVKSKHQKKDENKYVANRKNNVSEGETMFDIFPEINQCVPQKGGEIKNISITNKIKSTEKPKEIVPKKIQRDKKLEGVMSKKEIVEMINSANPAPSKPAPNAPTTTPTKPGQKPQRQNPFRPKPGTNPNPKGGLPKWLSSNSLGIGKNGPVNENIKKLTNLIKNLI